MKRLVLLMSGISLLFAGCTTETKEWTGDDGKITRIYVDAPLDTDASKATSRTVTNDHSVTWTEGDEIALFKDGDRTNYKRFRLMSNPGSKSGYFTGVTTDDYLTEGGSYKVIYPYSAAAKTGTNNLTRLSLYEIEQTDEGSTHLAGYDWLESAYHTVSVANPIPAFVLNHCFTLLKVTLTVEGADEDNTEYDEYLTNLSISSIDNSNIFAQRVYLGNDNNVEVSSYGVMAVVFRNPKAWLSNKEYTFWQIVKQDEALGIHDLRFNLYFSHGTGGNVLWNVDTIYSPASVLRSGQLYRIKLKAVINGATRTGSLEVASVN